MLKIITNPVGIDVRIRKIQEALYNRLMLSWGNIFYESYARCYRNKKENQYIAEVYTGEKEYKDVYWNDTVDVVSFFGVGATVSHKIGEMADIHLVFFVNIEKLKPAITHRADEEIRVDVLNILGRGIHGSTYVSVETGLENVLKEYPGSFKALSRVDMHPIHCFRINLKLNYNIKDCY